MSNLPKHIIRFFGNPSYALETIALKQITFIHNTKLNDPFDPWMKLVLEGNFDQFCSWVHKNRSHHEKRFKKFFTRDRFNSTIDEVNGIFSKLRESLYLFSTCEVNKDTHPKDNLYMWAHYANGHRGVALEFDAQALDLHFRKIDKLTESPLMKIHYGDQPPKITFLELFKFMTTGDSTEFREKVNKTSVFKNSVWENEVEWRLVEKNDETAMDIVRRPLADNIVTALYLGCRCDENTNKKFIFEMQKNYPNATIYLAKQNDDNAELFFEKLNVDDAVRNIA
jgi:hypothetical protein